LAEHTVQLRYTTVGDYRVHSLHAGAGTPVVLLHGLSGSARWWRYTIPALAEQHAVHVPELVGFGRSKPALREFSIDELARVVLRWLDANQLNRVHLVGHSMGAQTAIHLASDHPGRIERLVLVSASGIPRPLAPSEVIRFVTEVVPPRAWGAPLFLPSIVADAVRAGPLVLTRATRALLTDDVRPRLSRIEAETLLIWGELDPLTPLAHGELMARTIPNARIVKLARAAHNPMVDRAADFNRELLAFLQS
jgi:pimeloyl-ACP methyl ester carboxylesterase